MFISGGSGGSIRSRQGVRRWEGNATRFSFIADVPNLTRAPPFSQVDLIASIQVPDSGGLCISIKRLTKFDLSVIFCSNFPEHRLLRRRAKRFVSAALQLQTEEAG